VEGHKNNVQHRGLVLSFFSILNLLFINTLFAYGFLIFRRLCCCPYNITLFVSLAFFSHILLKCNFWTGFSLYCYIFHEYWRNPTQRWGRISWKCILFPAASFHLVSIRARVLNRRKPDVTLRISQRHWISSTCDLKEMP